MEKVGFRGSEPASEAMIAGSRLERPILKLGAHFLAKKILHNRQSFRHPLWPEVPLWATPDGFTEGRSALAEVKLVGHRWSDWQDGPPAYVALQVQAQLACLPRTERAHVIALLGSEIRTYVVERDPAVQDALPALVADWWQSYVVAEMAPDPASDEDRWELIRATLRIGEGARRMERLAVPEEQELGAELMVLLGHEEALKAQIEERRQRLALDASESDIAGAGWTARWAQRRSVDWRALAVTAEIPEGLIAEYTRATPAFTFRRTQKKEAS
jgi:hypothetical protein